MRTDQTMLGPKGRAEASRRSSEMPGENRGIDAVHFGTAPNVRMRLDAPENSKGCDIGYALAISSCEGANSVDACTVTALDAITAFAVPNPNCSSQSQSVFSGPVALRVAPFSRSPSLLRTGKVLIKPTLSAVDVCKVK